MILLDTNALVALVDERDGLHGRARRDLRRLRRGPYAVTSLVLGEACFLLTTSYLRQRLRFLLAGLAVEVVELASPWIDDLFAWLERYSEHDPDLADAQLAVLTARLAASRVWSYDREFRAIWRRPDGSPVPMAVSAVRS